MSQNIQNLKHWHYSIDRETIGWVVFDREKSSANALGRLPLEELSAIIDDVQKRIQDQSIRGLVFLSGKERSFIVGADINEFESLVTESQVFDQISHVNTLFDKIEALSIPVIAAVHGVCVGGGLEFILACHYRIATKDPVTKFGFPEVKLGIFPGFNGTARSIRQIGPLRAMRLMLTGSFVSANSAKSMGLIDQLVVSSDSLRWAARKAVLRRRKSHTGSFLQSFLCLWPFRHLLVWILHNEVSKKVRKEHYPAPYKLLELFLNHGGSYTAIKKAETELFAPLMISDQSRNLRRVFKLSEILKSQAPKTLKWKPQRVHVIGAGTMGAGIAGVCVASGLEVTLQDISDAQIEKGIRSQYKLFKKKFKSKASFEASKARLIPDPKGLGISRADVVVEAIVEKLDIKQNLFKEIEPLIKNGAVLATNTSSLKLSDISFSMKNPSRLIGLHFFSPVSLMPLVEVVRGARTQSEEVQKAALFVTSIDKFPLITKDTQGFLVNRVLGPYMFSAISRVERGEDKNYIDEAIRSFGMPMGPIELADSVGLDVCLDVAKTFGHSVEGTTLEKLVNMNKLGKKSGEGFYQWNENKVQKAKNNYSKDDLIKFGRQLIEPLLTESQKALSEHIVDNADLLDAGLIYGAGFAPFRGGPLHFLKHETVSTSVKV